MVKDGLRDHLLISAVASWTGGYLVRLGSELER